MSQTLDPHEMARARALLRSPVATDRVWPVLAAAAACAAAALAFAVAMVLAPPLTSEHTAGRAHAAAESDG
jgi:hypothetical protein